MNKTLLIIWREYFERIRKKSFLVMSILGPVLVASGFALMIWLGNADKTEQKVLVIDESLAFYKNLPDNDFIRFYYPDIKLAQATKDFYKTDYTCILYVPYNVAQSGNSPVKLFYKKTPGFAVSQYLRDVMERKLYEFKLAANNINPEVIRNARQNIQLINEKIYENGDSKESKTDAISVIGFVCGLLIFIFLTIYGAQVMRSVMEEKTNRVVEIIVSSVRPFQLMIGKIIGIALVGITQFLIWIVLSTILTTAVSATLLKKITADANLQKAQQEIVYKQGSSANLKELHKTDSRLEAIAMINDLKGVDFTAIIICFFLYFLGGYLFYSALFAAVGSAIDSDSDTQQFIMPITLPLIIAYMMSISVMQNPEGNIAFWGSMIPFTSPVVMLVRLPTGVPLWQLITSLSLLIGGFMLTTWIAGRIYRTGILMYGKKVSWKEMIKWISYKA
ncbi:MAG TPA: ABC transporter permease [Bacteroidia bacterium]|jgi:ABC-2 type transport system permease protein|nr:ABC transporter permease [Bacteroidia bacterium]